VNRIFVGRSYWIPECRKFARYETRDEKLGDYMNCVKMGFNGRYCPSVKKCS
jgi:hypothetical protein